MTDKNFKKSNNNPQNKQDNANKIAQKPKFIFITGGVLSSLGKGLVAASTGCILKEYGYNVNLKKMDPYLNVDPGTMNPMQHGEVFVTDDGTEADLDLGNYERMTDITTSYYSTTTSGKIYQKLLKRERKGYYLGKTVQVIPHVTGLIKEFLLNDAEKYDFNIVEVGGTVGDIESTPFLEAIRQLRAELGYKNTMFLHLSFVPYLGQTDEVKTKPTQHSVKMLMQAGIIADAIMCRTKQHISEKDKKKIAMFCNVDAENVIEAPDVDEIYSLPYIYAKQGLSQAIFNHFGIDNVKADDAEMFTKWNSYSTKKHDTSLQEVVVCIAGKYGNSNDCYKSLVEAIKHAGFANNVKIKLQWIDTHLVDDKNIAPLLAGVNCIIVPGGFGVEGVEGKIAVIKYARENNIPYLGICFGMQLAVIEFMRNVVGEKNATSTEFDENAKVPVVYLMKAWECKNGTIEERNKDYDLGGTMRLGAYTSVIEERTLAMKIYNDDTITERHRHRYEINSDYIETIEKHGGKFSAFAKVKGDMKGLRIPEIFENPKCKFFISCQFHPEFLSRPFACHPLFKALINAGLEYHKNSNNK